MVEPMAITSEMRFSKQARLDKAIEKQNASIKLAAEHGRAKTCFQCYDTVSEGDLYEEMKKIYERAGYTIKPTGYIGGVYQKTMDICW